MNITIAISLVLAGLVTGIYSGIVGSGGNIILIPVLDMVLSEMGYTHSNLVLGIIGHSLCVTIFTGIVASYMQYLNQNFFIKPVILCAIPGIFFSLATSWLIQNSDWYNKKTFDLVFLILLLPLILKLFIDKKSGVLQQQEKDDKLLYAANGSISGIVTSLSGMGGGIVLIPFFTDVMKMNIKKASSVSIGVIPFLALPATVTYLLMPIGETIVPAKYQVGYINWLIISPLLAGLLSGIPIGINLSKKLPARSIRIIFALAISLVACKLLIQLIHLN